MKKAVWLGLAGTIVFGLLSVVTPNTASAIPPFFKEFETKYVTAGSPFEAEVTRVKKCNVCHEGATKKMRNAYGQALDERLDKMTDAKDPEKIQAALQEVENLPSDPTDASSPTFGAKIQQGQLPAGG